MTRSSQKGLSILELMIALGLMGIVALVGTSILGNASKESIYVENRNIVRQTTSLLGKVSNKISQRVTPSQFDPFNSLSFSNSRIGEEWKEIGDLTGAATTLKSQEQGKQLTIYDKLNLDQQLKLKPSEIQSMTIDEKVKGLSECEKCRSCETAHLSAPVEKATCSPINSCYYSTLATYDRVQRVTKYKEKITLCDKSALSGAGLYVRSLMVGGFNGAQSSHDLVVSDMQLSNDVKVSAADFKSNTVYMSRCVETTKLNDIDKIQKITEIDSLRRPILIPTVGAPNASVNHYTSSDIKCCLPPSNKTGEWTSKCEALVVGGIAKYLPTIFVYSGENNVLSLPAKSERFLIPGLALVMQFDSQSPKTFRLQSFQIENACKTGRKRSSWPCAADQKNPFIPAKDQFNEQVEVKVISASGSVASGIVGSGIINFGNTLNFEK